jgi:hypothetical protein
MTAFLEFLNTFAIWIYIGGVVAVLFGIKMLLDARRAARTTLFTLEQEQASDRAFRALVVMGLATFVIAFVAAVNAFVSPAVPGPEPDVVEPTDIPYTPPIFLPTATTQPTLTPPPPTPGPTARPTQAPAPVATGAPAESPTPEEPTLEPTAVSDLIYPMPPLNTPPDRDSIGANFIRFSWGNSQFDTPDVPQFLPPDQWYRVTIMYTDRSSNSPVVLVKCTHESSFDTRTGIDLSDRRGNAVDAIFTWNVIVVRTGTPQECESGSGQLISPPSPTFTFLLP